MLREIPKVRQIEGEPRRRWFTDEHFDLVIWGDDSSAILGFQLCYDKTRSEHALTWKSGDGFIHNRVDTGEDRPGRYKSTPILVADGEFDVEDVAAKFLGHSDGLDADSRDFIYYKLLDYPIG
jgi:hypothetical protein